MAGERLQRVMKTPEVLFIGINGVVGGGIFLLPDQVAQQAGAAAVYTHIKVRHIVSGEGITQESLEKAVNLSHEKYCSVAASLNAEIEAEADLEH